MAGGVWQTINDSSGNPLTITPSITDSSGASFGSSLPAGTYRVDYAGGTLSYSAPPNGNLPFTDVDLSGGSDLIYTWSSADGTPVPVQF